MAIADILRDIGTGTRAAGAVGSTVGQSLVNEEAGYAPQIAAEKRQHQEAMEDAQINSKAQELESSLAMGQKYGTLTPQQQQQYVDQISQLYSHPRHAGTLMEKLRKAIHPNGAVAQGPTTPLPNATPEGGTEAADVRAANDKKAAKPLTGVRPFKGSDGKYYQPVETADGKIENVEVPDYTPPPVKPAGGKSPPVPGNQLPSDAAGPDGKPIPDAERNAGKSYVEFHGAFYPVAPPRPKLQELRGHMVLVDANGKVLRDLGPKDAVKVTTRQTLQPGDDGQMHLVNLTSVTTPEGASIDVDSGAEPPSSEGESKPSTAKGVGSVLPRKHSPAQKPSTGAKPVSPSSGPVVPGLRTLAASKNPLFKSDVAQYTKVAEDANNKAEAYKSAQTALAAGSTASSDQELIYSWVRSNVQGAGRMTQAEFKQAASVGSLPQRAQIAWEKAKSGKLPPEIEKMFLDDIKRAADTSQQEADDLRKKLGLTDTSTQAAPKVIVVSAEDMK